MALGRRSCAVASCKLLSWPQQLVVAGSSCSDSAALMEMEPASVTAVGLDWAIKALYALYAKRTVTSVNRPSVIRQKGITFAPRKRITFPPFSLPSRPSTPAQAASRQPQGVYYLFKNFFFFSLYTTTPARRFAAAHLPSPSGLLYYQIPKHGRDIPFSAQSISSLFSGL